MKRSQQSGKRALVKDLMAKGVPARRAAEAVNTVFHLMAEALYCHESVEVPGVGTLEVMLQRGKPARRSQKTRNIATKQIQVHNVAFPGRRRVIKLRPDPHLKLPASLPAPVKRRTLSDIVAALDPPTPSSPETPEQLEARQLASELLAQPAHRADVQTLQKAVELHPFRPGSLLRRLKEFRDRGWKFNSIESLAAHVAYHYWL